MGLKESDWKNVVRLRL